MNEPATCTCCGRPMPTKTPLTWDLKSRTLTSQIGAVRLSPRKAIYIDALYRARNRGGIQTRAELMDAVYADKEDGGPDDFVTGSVHLNQIRKKIEPVGWTISKNLAGEPYQLIPFEWVVA